MLNNKPIRPTHIPQVYYAYTECMFNNLRINKNAIIYKDGTGDIYVCNRMPSNYKGTDPLLTVSIWDAAFQYWDTIQLKSYATRIMYEAWCAGGMKKTTHSEDIQFSNDCIRKFKWHGMRHKPSMKNPGEIQLSCGECIIAQTFNTNNTLSYNSNIM